MQTVEVAAKSLVLTDGSRIIIESLVQSGADVYVGYPITPANWFYAYAQERFPQFLAAPDEITVLQWMAGLSAVGKIPVTATSFPGFALMVESLNMAYMMELPMVILLAQRMGPSTGSATTGAQGDLLLLKGAISGGYPFPVFCPSDFSDCWTLANRAVAAARRLRTPVVLLTSKEMVMTKRSFDLEGLAELPKIKARKTKIGSNNTDIPPSASSFKTYESGEKGVPPFVAAGNPEFQIRMNSSTHDQRGFIGKNSPEVLENTRRLKEKMESGIHEFTFYEFDTEPGAKDLIITYGISADAARDALKLIRNQGKRAALLVVKTLLPVPPDILLILKRFPRLLFVEENLSGHFQEILYGAVQPSDVRSVNKIGSMINPVEILNAFPK
jgi:2-oxoglutarate ferredoxin oxidoreductase subunit alpha